MSLSADPERSFRRTQTTCLVLLTLIAVGFALYFLQSVLLPFVIALFIVSGCRPILDFLENRCHLHWFLAFIVTFVAGVLLLAVFSFMVWISVNDLQQHSQAYSERMTDIVTWAEQKFIPRGESTNEELPIEGPAGDDAESNDAAGDTAASDDAEGEDAEDGGSASDDSEDDSETTRREDLEDDMKEFRQQTSEAMKDMLASLRNLAQTVIVNLATMLTSLLSYGVLILIFVFFLLLGRSNKQAYRPQIVQDVDDQVRKYIVMKTVISALTGLATTIVLWIFGVPLAIVFGMLAFLLNFIPNIGPVISMMLPVPFLVLNPDMALWAAITVFILICAIQFISGNVIETRVMGKSFDVSPVVLLLALMFFGLVWGIVGMFLATPIVSIIKIVLNQNDSTRPAAELLAGRWQRPNTA